MMDGDVLFLVKIVVTVLGAVLVVVMPVLSAALKRWIDGHVNEQTLAMLTEIVREAVAAAEQMFEDNAEKKAYVLRMIMKAEAALNLDLPDELVEMLLDMLIEAEVYELKQGSGPVLTLVAGEEG